jgi:hypothetical protein
MIADTDVFVRRRLVERGDGALSESARGGSVCPGVVASPDYCFDQFTRPSARYGFGDQAMTGLDRRRISA